jgi:hypothetical protein
MRTKRIALWLSGGLFLVTLLGIIPAYLVLFDKAELVYEARIVDIPLPKDLPGQLPDRVVFVEVENIGRRPSIDLEGTVGVNGDLIEYEVKGPNPAYGEISQSRTGTQVSFACKRLASGSFPIKITAWYRAASSDPDIGVSDSLGAARRVVSIAAEKDKFKIAGTGLLGFLAGLFGSVLALIASYREWKTRKSISDAVKEIDAALSGTRMPDESQATAENDEPN